MRIAMTAPLWRLLAALLLSAPIACLPNLPAALASLFPGFLLLCLVRPPLSTLLPRLWAVNLFLAFMWLITPFTAPGNIVWQWHFLKLSREGIDLCLLATCKANAIAFIFIALLTPLSMFQFGSALTSLGCPHKLAWLFLLMERNVSLLQTEWRRLREAAALRSFCPACNWRAYGTIAAMLGLLVIRADRRAKNLADAMLLAGYNGRIPFSNNNSPNKQDFILLVFAIATVVCLGAIAFATDC